MDKVLASCGRSICNKTNACPIAKSPTPPCEGNFSFIARKNNLQQYCITGKRANVK